MGQEKKVMWEGDNVASKTFAYGNGWVSSTYNSIAAQIYVATLTASFVTVRVEGRFDSDSRAASIYCERYTTAHTISKLINVVADVGNLRVGAIASPPASVPNNLYVDLLLYDEK